MEVIWDVKGFHLNPMPIVELINEFLNYFHLFAVNLDNICSGLLDTFYSDDRLSSSAIDLIVVPRSHLQHINLIWRVRKG